MTVYTEFLRDRLSRSPAGGQPVGALVADVVIRRARLLPTSWGGPRTISRAADGSPERLLDLLDYDESLVRLCDQLGVEHRMLDPFAPLGARDETEQALSQRLPLLAMLEYAPAC